MKIGVMQPYFFPYLGYWQLINSVDIFIVYDDVTYIKGGWINRNQFLMNHEKKLFSISLNGSSSYKLINEIEIKDDFVKFLKMIKTNYSKAPFFKNTLSLIEDIVSYENKNLAYFLQNSIVSILKYLAIDKPVILSSNIDNDKSLSGQSKILDICNTLNADTYINSIGGQNLYSRDDFQKENKSLFFIEPCPHSYSQFNDGFVSDLSILDILMFNSIDDTKKLLTNYKLI
ncbi:WbqC family protein [Pectobacterium versatile]|uniref:WbqC family protein n=1 Tax=Pectobacterium versatile TaxID=2488639 RepID=UPI000F653791|nr:WbqC family protein [Pectobacterium versatile]AZK60962.1 hypothetical protein EIP93_00870 [Pectobacterium versatile]UCP81538.1 WbqC family protein [Pectobacterium versatile]GKX40104.1 hypothetical protein SOASR014_38430 [Pectobacterium carotovorum subsp. carotovorum]GLX46310.1 hypothetical protein Pcaca01_39780 [Pectobacterium carotovorum subsp. carotovorum]